MGTDLTEGEKSYEEWLEEFKTNIEEGYEAYRMDTRIAGYAQEVQKPARTLWIFDNPVAVGTTTEERESYTVTMPLPSSRPVEPFPARFLIDLKDWGFRETVSGLNSYMFRKGNQVAEMEYFGILKGLSDNAGNIIEAEKKGELSEQDIQKAKIWVGQNGGRYPDIVVMPIDQETKLLKEGKLWLPHKIRSGYISDMERAPYFLGMIGNTKAYHMRFIKDYALVFAKNEVIVRNTPLKVYFDESTRPSHLIIEKWCSSAPTLDQAVVKIQL